MDVNQYIFRYWRLLKGEFTPAKPNSKYMTIGEDTAESIGSVLSSTKYKVVCVNDDPMSCDFETEMKKMQEIFNEKFADSCSYEK